MSWSRAGLFVGDVLVLVLLVVSLLVLLLGSLVLSSLLLVHESVFLLGPHRRHLLLCKFLSAPLLLNFFRPYILLCRLFQALPLPNLLPGLLLRSLVVDGALPGSFGAGSDTGRSW